MHIPKDKQSINMKLSAFRGFVLVFFFSFYLQAFSQTDKWKFMMGGQYDLNFNSYTSNYKGSNSSYEIGKYKTFDISPQIGLFLFSNIPVGIEFLYSYEIMDNGINSSSSFNLMPFVRYYFCHSKIKPYLNIEAGPGWEKMKGPGFVDPGLSIKIFTYKLGGGICTFINDFVSLDLSIGYKSSTQIYTFHYPIDGDYTSKTRNKGFGASFGIMVYL